MKIKFVLIGLIFVFAVRQPVNAIQLFHPVHISLINLDLSDDKTIAFSIKLFKDDFAKILNRQNNTHITFTENTEKNDVEAVVVKYVCNHFNIKGVGDILDCELTGIKVNDASVWLYFNMKRTIQKIKTIEISNSLMTDLYQDQTNLFIMNYKGKDLAQRFDNNKQVFKFNFK